MALNIKFIFDFNAVNLSRNSENTLHALRDKFINEIFWNKRSPTGFKSFRVLQSKQFYDAILGHF